MTELIPVFLTLYNVETLARVDGGGGQTSFNDITHLVNFVSFSVQNLDVDHLI